MTELDRFNSKKIAKQEIFPLLDTVTDSIIKIEHIGKTSKLLNSSELRTIDTIIGKIAKLSKKIREKKT